MSTRLLLGLAVVVLLALGGAWLLLDDGRADGGDVSPLDGPRADGAAAIQNPAALDGDRGAAPRASFGATPTQLPDGGATLTRAHGRVVSRAGAPLAGARVVALLVPRNPFEGPPALSGQETLTDADGHFELLGLPADVRLAVEADAAGYAPDRKQGFRLSEGEARDVGTLTLDVGLAMVGEVRDEFGTPIEGALVSVTDVERSIVGDELGAFVGEALSDVDGRYRVPHLARRQYEITAVAEGHATASAQITFVLGQEVQEWTQDFVLETTGSVLAGWVLGPDDAGVAGATLHLSRRPGGAANSLFRTSTTTDGNGDFRFDDLPDGHFELRFEADGFYLPARRKLASGVEDHEIRVQPAIRVHGELTAEGAPLPARFHVRVRPDAATGAGLLPGAPYEQEFHVPDAPGRFTLDGLKPGAYTFEVLAEGFALSRGSQLVLGTSQTEADLRIPLRRGGSLRGTLLPATPNVLVELRSADWDPSLSIELAFPTPPLPGLATRSDEQGAFVLDHVPEGLYVVSASPADGPATHLREVSVLEGRATDLGNVRLMRSGRVGGQVFDEFGAPASNARITLSAEGYVQQTTADGEGLYTFEGVPEGYAELVATPPGLWDALRAEGRGEVRVEADRPARLDLAFAPRKKDG